MPALAKRPPIFYLIADLSQGGRDGKPAAAIATAVRQVASPAELTLLFQLRDKEATAHALYQAALAWREGLQPHSAHVLINERVDLAITTGLLGVHLSKESYAIEEACALLPEGLLGYSAHSPREARDAAAAGAGLITLSPIFASPQKGDPVGLGPLEEAALTCADIPVIALGGISQEELWNIAKTGASGIAIVRAVFGADDPPKFASQIAGAIVEAWGN